MMLKDVEEISAPRAPSIEYFFITSTDIATIVGASSFGRDLDTHLERSPPMMPLFFLSVISSVARSKDSPRKSRLSSGLNVTSGLRISSSSVKHSRLVPHHHLSVLGWDRIDESPITAQETHP